MKLLIKNECCGNNKKTFILWNTKEEQQVIESLLLKLKENKNSRIIFTDNKSEKIIDIKDGKILIF